MSKNNKFQRKTVVKLLDTSLTLRGSNWMQMGLGGKSIVTDISNMGQTKAQEMLLSVCSFVWFFM